MCKICEEYYKDKYYAFNKRSDCENLLMASQSYTGIEIENTEEDGLAIVAMGDFSAIYYPKYARIASICSLSSDTSILKRIS